MIRTLLSHRFPSEYGLDPANISLPVEVKNGSFSLSDNKACSQCKAIKADRASCNEENLNVHSSNDVAVLDFEKYIAQFSGTRLNIKNVCDFLMFDEGPSHQKIAFCDLTCSEEKWVNPNTGKYPEGKRTKVKTQMLASLEYLLSEPLTSFNILTFVERVCLFGWRDYNNPNVSTVRPVHNNVGNNMKVFGKTPSSLAKQLTAEKTILGHNFYFVEVKYPSEYEF